MPPAGEAGLLVPRLLHPEWTPLLAVGLGLAALALGAAALRAGRRRRRLLGAGPRLPRAGGDLVLWLALACLGLALLRPELGTRLETVDASGVDVVALLDVSRSMDARDTPPSRLARARRNLEAVLARLAPGDRVALAAFAGRGVLLTPLTPDLQAVTALVPHLDSELMRARGSRLGAGVRAAVAAFDPDAARPRVLLVLSDGEDPEPEAGDLGAAEAARAGARVLAVPVGESHGATIPDHGIDLRDDTGALVRSRARPERLAALARATDGALLPVDGFGGLDVPGAVQAIRRDAPHSPDTAVQRRVPAERGAVLAGLAFLLLGLEWARPWPRRRRAALALAGALALAASAPGAGRADGPEPAAGQGAAAAVAGRGQGAAAAVARRERAVAERPDDAVALLRLGVARARAGETTPARRALEAALLHASTPGLRALAHYDLGVLALERGELRAARDAFLEAVALDPDDVPSRFNLEWTLRALREPPSVSGVEPLPQPESSQEAPQAEAPATDARGRAPQEPAAGATERDGTPAAASRTEEAGLHVPRLSPGEVERWLDAVQEEPGRALRDTARRQGGGARNPAGAPSW